MLELALLNIFGGVLFLFLFWRKLKEDYSSKILFGHGFFVLFGIFAGLFLSMRFIPNAWFWLSFSGATVGFILGIIRYKPRFYESFEACIAALFPWLAGIYLFDSIKTSSLISALASLLVICIYALFHWIDGNYKSFFWYKSGRIGAAGVISLGVFFLTRTAIATFLGNMVSFVGAFEVFLSGAVSFLSFMLLFNLSRSEQ